MKPHRLLVLIILVIGILAVPVAADVAYGPDHYTLQKNGTLDLSTATPEYLHQDMIINSPIATHDLIRSVLIINCTLKKYPVQFSLPNVISGTTKSWSALPPALEAKFVFKVAGTTHVMANLTVTAYKQAQPYVNYYGYFTYVNTPYLNTRTGNIQSDSPTIIYDNITNGGVSQNLQPAYAGDTVNLTKITDIAGFYWASTGIGAPVQLWVDPLGDYYTVYSLVSQIEYGVTNDPPTHDKVIMINRPNGEQSHLQIYQNSTLQYESESKAINESHLIFPSTHGIFKIWVNTTALNYTIFDDNISAYTPPPPTENTWDLNVFTYDGSSGALYNGATVTKTDLTDPAYNGWGISGVDYPGRTDFQAIQDHEYNLSATATGMSTGYANYTASTSPSIVKLYLYPYLGYSTLEFKVVDTGDRPITGLPVRLSDGRGKLTVAGFTRFNSTDGVSYGWTVGDATTSQYVPQTGNVTATAGRTTIEVVMPLVSEIANLTEPTPPSPHVAAQEFMDFIYGTVPGLAIVAVLFLFLAMMGYNPAGMAGKRGGRRR